MGLGHICLVGYTNTLHVSKKSNNRWIQIGPAAVRQGICFPRTPGPTRASEHAHPQIINYSEGPTAIAASATGMAVANGCWALACGGFQTGAGPDALWRPPRHVQVHGARLAVVSGSASSRHAPGALQHGHRYPGRVWRNRLQQVIIFWSSLNTSLNFDQY